MKVLKYNDGDKVITASASSTFVAKFSTEQEALEALATKIVPDGASYEIIDHTAIEKPAPTNEDVIAERDRRLALGFDYDFGDARGVHRIGTTKEDLAGWDEVTTASNAFISLGQPSTVINIVTDTGPCAVTALEWQGIIAQSAIIRQPIWTGSFVLQAMNPIPSDYEDNSYWV